MILMVLIKADVFICPELKQFNIKNKNELF